MRGYAAIALYQPKNTINVGSVLRAAWNYNAAVVITSGNRYRPVPTDTMNSFKHIPLIQVEDIFNSIPYDCVPIAVDLLENSQSLFSYKHPERAFYIFGAEDGTLEKTITEKCRDIVSIPTRGCMNLAACVNVVLYDRLLKQQGKVS